MNLNVRSENVMFCGRNETSGGKRPAIGSQNIPMPRERQTSCEGEYEVDEAAYCLTCWWFLDNIENHSAAYEVAARHLEKNLGHEVRITNNDPKSEFYDERIFPTTKGT